MSETIPTGKVADAPSPAALQSIADMDALYRMFGASGELLYIGITGRVRRFDEHGEKRWFPLVTQISLEWLPDIDHARVAERRAIAMEHPFYNIAGKLPPGTRVCEFPVSRSRGKGKPRRRREPRDLLLRDSSNFSETARETLMGMLGDAKGTTIRRAAAGLGVSPWVARVWLENLRREGIARVEGSKKAARWKLQPHNGDGL